MFLFNKDKKILPCNVNLSKRKKNCLLKGEGIFLTFHGTCEDLNYHIAREFKEIKVRDSYDNRTRQSCPPLHLDA